MSFSPWVEQNSPQLVGGGRWLRGNGPNWVQPEEWDSRPFRVLIARLSPWEDTLQSSTHRLLYAILRRKPGVFPDLAYMPPLRDTQRMLRDGIPWWLATGTHRSPLDFDCIAISNALVQELVNLPPLLRASGIPSLHSERMDLPEIPLLILGGANSLHASALWSADPCVDGIFVGEDPELVERIFTLIADDRLEGRTKRHTLQRLADSIPGFFLPAQVGVGSRVTKSHQTLPSVNAYKPWEPMLPSPDIAGVASLQVSEGCPSFCSFCAESYARKPYREVPLGDAHESALELKAALGLEEIELFSFNFNNHAQILDMVPALLHDFGRVGLKSQRFDALANDPALVHLMRIAGKASLTCGLEGISERMRAYLQKGLPQALVQRALEAMMREPLRELKVFLIATGREESADLEEFRAFLKWFMGMVTRSSRRPRITFSATPLVRFPWTPLEFEPAPDAEACGRALRAVKDCVVRSGFDYREAAGEWECEVSQILVRARDPRVFRAMDAAQQATGFLYAEAIEETFAQAFRTALSAQGLTHQECLQGHGYQDEVPWAHVSPGIDRKFLFRMHRQSLDAVQVPICLGKADAAGRCMACDACNGDEKALVTKVRKPKTPQLAAVEESLRSLRAQERELRILVRLGPRCHGWPWKTLGAWLMRALIHERASLLHGFRRHLPADWEARLDEETCLVTGEVALGFVVLEAEKLALEASLMDRHFLEHLGALVRPWMDVLGVAAPGLQVERIEFTGLPDFRPDAWLNAKGLKHTLVKKGAVREYAFSKDALKKKLFTGLYVDASQGKMTAVPADKFNLLEFARACSAFSTPDDWRRVRMQSFYKR